MTDHASRYLFCFCAILTAILCVITVGRASDLVSTEAWLPPDLSDATVEEPQLLILKVAQEEVGYVEGKNNYSKYGEWMGTPCCQWCAEFVTWCVNQVDERYGTDLLRNTYPYYSNPEDGAPFFIQRGRFVAARGTLAKGNKQYWPDTWTYVKNGDYIPEPGDYMWFSMSSRSETFHVALVEGASIGPDGTVMVHVIEGNRPDRVQRNTYRIDEQTIYGYGTTCLKARTETSVYHTMMEIEDLKGYLANLGFYQGDDQPGVFTKDLRTAVRKFQKQNGLKVNGSLNRDTVRKIFEAVGKE